MQEMIKCLLTILTPVHVGCGEVFEPTGFTIDEQEEALVVFDPLDFIEGLGDDERQRFATICAQGSLESLLEIYKFMRERKVKGRYVKLCAGFLDHYQKAIAIGSKERRRIRSELNNFTVHRTAFLPIGNQPYIPGSALKGSLRTAYLNAVAEKTAPMDLKRWKRPQDKARELEKRLLGGAFDTDPFRLLKVSDFLPVGTVETKIIYAVNRKKKPSKFEARGPYQMLEVIKPGASFEGTIQVQPAPPAMDLVRPFKLDILLKSALYYYYHECEREAAELAGIGSTPFKVPSKDGYPVRIGRHSGAESVTIKGYREIRIMQGKGQTPKWMDRATTLWLAAESRTSPTNKYLRPFGWAFIEPDGAADGERSC